MGLFTSLKVGAERTPRDELRRRQRERFAMSSGLPELNRSGLRFDRFVVVHEPSGDQFRIYRGEISTGPTHPISAYFYDEAGGIVFLERLPGARR